MFIKGVHMKIKIVSLSEIAKNQNLSLSPGDYIEKNENKKEKKKGEKNIVKEE